MGVALGLQSGPNIFLFPPSWGVSKSCYEDPLQYCDWAGPVSRAERFGVDELSLSEHVLHMLQMELKASKEVLNNGKLGSWALDCYRGLRANDQSVPFNSINDAAEFILRFV